MKFNESEKLQIAIAYATSKACNTPEDFISNVNNMLDELSPKNWYSKNRYWLGTSYDWHRCYPCIVSFHSRLIKCFCRDFSISISSYFQYLSYAYTIYRLLFSVARTGGTILITVCATLTIAVTTTMAMPIIVTFFVLSLIVFPPF